MEQHGDAGPRWGEQPGIARGVPAVAPDGRVMAVHIVSVAGLMLFALFLPWTNQWRITEGPVFFALLMVVSLLLTPASALLPYVALPARTRAVAAVGLNAPLLLLAALVVANDLIFGVRQFFDAWELRSHIVSHAGVGPGALFGIAAAVLAAWPPVMTRDPIADATARRYRIVRQGALIAVIGTAGLSAALAMALQLRWQGIGSEYFHPLFYYGVTALLTLVLSATVVLPGVRETIAARSGLIAVAAVLLAAGVLAQFTYREGIQFLGNNPYLPGVFVVLAAVSGHACARYEFAGRPGGYGADFDRVAAGRALLVLAVACATAGVVKDFAGAFGRMGAPWSTAVAVAATSAPTIVLTVVAVVLWRHRADGSPPPSAVLLALVLPAALLAFAPIALRTSQGYLNGYLDVVVPVALTGAALAAAAFGRGVHHPVEPNTAMSGPHPVVPGVVVPEEARSSAAVSGGAMPGGGSAGTAVAGGATAVPGGVPVADLTVAGAGAADTESPIMPEGHAAASAGNTGETPSTSNGPVSGDGSRTLVAADSAQATRHPAPLGAAAIPPPGYPMQGYPRPELNPLAIISLVVALVGCSPVAVILGHVALGQIRRRGEDGRGLAVAGLVVGYLSLVATVLVAALYVSLFTGLFALSSQSDYPSFHTGTPTTSWNPTTTTTADSAATDQAIRNAAVGSCLQRIEGSRRADGTSNTTVYPRPCSNSSATHRVSSRASNTSACGNLTWVRTGSATSGWVVLCLTRI